MLTIGLDPVLWSWGPLTLAWHGLFLTAGVALGCWIFARQARAAGLTPEPLLKLLLWMIVGGYAGARLLRVFLYDWQANAPQPLRILAVAEGGLAWYGALIGGTMAIAAFAYRRKLPFWRLIDATALGDAAGLILGRVGCIIAGDLYGVATAGWGLVYTHPDSQVPPYLLGVPTFPVPLLMLAADAALLAVLLLLRGRLRPGVLFLAYLISYSVARFLISLGQVEPQLLLGLHPTQVVAVVIGLGAAAALVVRHRQAPRGLYSPGGPG